MSLHYSTLVARKVLFCLFAKRMSLCGCTLSNRTPQGLFPVGKCCPPSELWVCGPVWTMLCTHHTWSEGGRSHSPHTLLSNLQSRACSNVSGVIRFMLFHREQFLPLTSRALDTSINTPVRPLNSDPNLSCSDFIPCQELLSELWQLSRFHLEANSPLGVSTAS